MNFTYCDTQLHGTVTYKETFCDIAGINLLLIILYDKFEIFDSYRLPILYDKLKNIWELSPVFMWVYLISFIRAISIKFIHVRRVK